MKDHYTKKSRKQGFKSRSVYKLKEINKKQSLIGSSDKVLDIGSYPGGWLQYCSRVCSKVVGVDIREVETDLEFYKLDILKEDIFKVLKGKFDVVISDVSPKKTGVKSLDQDKSVELNLRVLELLDFYLKKRGNFLMKVFQGEGFEELLKEVKKRFEFVKVVKPKASKSGSKEVYVVGKNRK
tara:strand:+ start:9 stop:554 length:546 start_codon:yes stop_codon:yes gene_type:complete